MPQQEGVQTIRQIRKHRADVATVAISGGLSFSHAANVDVLDMARKLGADDANNLLQNPAIHS